MNICRGCYSEIDPEVCHCGIDKANHNPYTVGHSLVPMGCICGYVDRNFWKPNEEEKKLLSLIIEMSNSTINAYGVERKEYFVSNLRTIVHELEKLENISENK